MVRYGDSDLDTRVIYAVFLALTVFLNLFASISFSVVKAESSNWIIQDFSFRSSTGGVVYPGSRNARLTVLARYSGDVEALNPTACIAWVPSGFQAVGSKCVPSRDPDGNAVHVIEPGNVTYFIFTLNVEREVYPGQYVALLNITYYVIGNSELQWEAIYVALEVSHYPPLNVVIKETYFTPYNYPGACPVNVVIGIVNNGKTSIEGLRLTLKLPSELADPSEMNYTYMASINSGEEAYFNLGTTCINPSANPNSVYSGVLYISAQLITDDGVVYSDEHYYSVVLMTGEVPGAKIRILNYELTSGSSLPGFKNTGLRVLIKSEEQGVFTASYSTLLLENAQTINGSNAAIYIHNIALNYLESAEIIYAGLSISDNASYVKAKIAIYGSVMREGVEYPVSFNFTVIIPLAEDYLEIKVDKVDWERGYAYPGSTGNTLIVVVVNNESSLSMVDAVIEVKMPNDITYPAKLVAYNIVLNRGSLVEVSFTGISVPTATKPGIYGVTINITGTLRGVDNSYRYMSILRNATIVIADLFKLEPLLPTFSVVDVFWGEVTPQYVYPGNARAPLTVVLQNIGPLAASNVLVFIENTYPDDVIALNNVASCSAQLVPGESCTAIFYLNLSKSNSGVKKLNLAVKYTIQGVGVNTVFTQPLSASVFLPEYSAGKGVLVASYSWLNNNPVFPRTKSAVLLITLANLEAYTTYSMWITLKTPTCMSIHEGSLNTVYVAGPLATLQTTTVSFTLDLNSCDPGIQPATIEIDYYLQTAGGGIRKKTTQVVNLFVEDDRGGIEYVTSGWASTPVNPPVYGAQYYIVFRNAKFPSITNPVLKLRLPSGIAESRTNSSEPIIQPTYRFAAQQAYLLQGAPSTIAQLISQYVQQPATESVGKGDFITYMISLNIELANLTEFDAPFTITFIDHWGQEYSISSILTIKLLTTPPLLEVYPVTPLVVFKNGTAVLDILVENKYDTPIGNLYLALIPVSSNAIPQNAVKYIERLNANSNATIKFELVYNPMQVMMGTVPVTMSSAVFTVTLLYVDATGILHALNTTLAVIIKPFIELAIMPGLTARYSKGSLVVNGVIANTGISSARSVVIHLKYGEVETINIVGDIDPASQTPFRIELQAPYSGDNCTLLVKYRDEYGSEYLLREELNVILVVEKTETSTPQQPFTDHVFRFVIVILVAVFLGGVFFVLYRHSKRAIKGVINETK